MAMINRVTPPSGVYNTLRILGSDKAIAWLDQVMAEATNTATGEDALSVLNRKLEEANLIGHSGTSGPPDPALASHPWIYIRTDRDAIYIKKPVGSNFEWIGPIFEGQHRTEIVYNTRDAPGNLSVSWNHETDTFSPSGGGWTGNSTNAKWARFVTLERNTNNYVVSPAFSLETGGAGTDDQNASEVPTDATNFNNNLSSADTNVQLALDTIDDIDFPPEQKQSWPARSGAVDATGISNTFTVISALINERTNYEEGIFIEAEADIRMEADIGAAGNHGTFVLDIVTGVDTETGVRSDPLRLVESVNPVPGKLRLTGILPATFTTGRIRVRRTATSTTPPPATAFEGFRLQMRLSVQADEVIVNQQDLGNNFTGDSDNLEELVSEVDEFPIQPADFEDVSWPDAPGGIDDDGMEVTRTITFHRNLQNVNNRPGHRVIARISFDAAIASGSGGAITQLNFTHRFNSGTLDLSSPLVTNRTGTNHTFDLEMPDNSINSVIGFTNTTGQSDGRLIITNYRLDYLLGIDAASFSGNLAATDTTLQRFAQKFNDYVAPVAAIDASSFGGSGNLATTDDTVQEVANAFNAYVPMPTAANTSITNPSSDNDNTFYNPNNVIGGIRGYPGLVADPANVRDALRSVDRRLADAYNPFQSTQLLDRFTGGSYTDSFSPTNLTGIYSSEVDIPQELIDLGTDVDIRIRVHVQSISGFRGDIGLTSGGTTTLISGTVRESVSDNVYDPNDYVTFERTVSAANVPETFRVHFRATAGSITLNQGFADVIDSDGGGAMGGAGGQTGGYTSTIIWLAGANINDRLTVASETTNYTLMSGHNFSDYDQLIFVFDGGSGPNQPLMPMWVDANLFQAFGAGGTLWIMGNWWLMVSRQSDNTFRFRWRGANNGLRRIIGINAG